MLGREPIELVSPRNRPFLTTRELFVLKGSCNRKLLKRYQTSNETQRRAILKELIAKPLPDVREFEGTNAVALDVEWFFTDEELCGLMKDVADLPLMSVNPVLIRKIGGGWLLKVVLSQEFIISQLG